MTEAAVAHDLLHRVDGYLDQVPRTASVPEAVGPFTLFRPTGDTPYYARPRPGTAVEDGDLERLAGRCADLSLPVAVEWVVDLCPTAGPAAERAGYAVTERPLLALASTAALADVPLRTGGTIERVPADAARILPARAVASVAFRAPGTGIAPGSVAARRVVEASFPPSRLRELVDRIARGLTVMLAARDADGEVVGSGQYHPVGDVAEVVAVATLPAHRRRGVAAALTAALVAEARRDGIDLLVLSAQDDAVARVYERVGFERIGRVGTAEPPGT